MPRNYKPKPGAKTYKKYDEFFIMQALHDLRSPSTSNITPSLTSIAKKYGIPSSVLQRHNKRTMKPHGGQPALSPETEEYIIRNLNICADWGYPIQKTDLIRIIKTYLDSANITIKRFKNNIPGPDFVDSFLKRHSDKISKHIYQNMKRSRAKTSPEIISQYFTELEKSIHSVPLANIINYDEMNLADGLGQEKVIVRRGCKYPEKVSNHSKGCVSLMIAASAEGDLLPPYVVYQSDHLCNTWTKYGPPGTRYNYSSSGWFDESIFADWVETIVIPYFDKKEGEKILIGDYLSLHISVDLITKCRNKDIHVIFLPPNSTHLTQPLSVSYYHPMKQAWQQILKKWKSTDGREQSSIPKDCFPKLLKLLLDHLKSNTKQNIRAGFRKCGIVPFDPQEVISRLPKESAEDIVNCSKLDESFIQLLKEIKYGTINLTESKKTNKFEVVAGRSIDPEQLLKNENSNVDLDKNKKCQSMPVISSEDLDFVQEEEVCNDIDAILIETNAETDVVILKPNYDNIEREGKIKREGTPENESNFKRSRHNSYEK